jgi:hypothetical protein
MAAEDVGAESPLMMAQDEYDALIKASMDRELEKGAAPSRAPWRDEVRACLDRTKQRRVAVLAAGAGATAAVVLLAWLLFYAPFAPWGSSGEALDDIWAPYNVTCGAYDDDAVYTAAGCASQDAGFCYTEDMTTCVDAATPSDDDATTACYTTCTNGTACDDWCGDACAAGWGAWCVWDVFAHLEDACAANYTPTSPARRRALRVIWGQACAYHARCDACGATNASEATCDDVYQKYYHRDWLDDYSGNEPAAAALEPAVFATWCAKFNYTYVAR